VADKQEVKSKNNNDSDNPKNYSKLIITYIYFFSLNLSIVFAYLITERPSGVINALKKLVFLPFDNAALPFIYFIAILPLIYTLIIHKSRKFTSVAIGISIATYLGISFSKFGEFEALALVLFFPVFLILILFGYLTQFYFKIRSGVIRKVLLLAPFALVLILIVNLAIRF
jgi:hypothetical protein